MNKEMGKKIADTITALSVAMDEVKRDNSGKFSSGGGGATAAKMPANTSNQAVRLQSIIKNGPRTKSEHAIMASHLTKQASVARRSGDLKKAANLETKAKGHKQKATAGQW